MSKQGDPYNQVSTPDKLPTRAELDQNNLALQNMAQRALARMFPDYVAQIEMCEDLDHWHKGFDRLMRQAGSEPSKRDTGGAGLAKLVVNISGIGTGAFSMQAETTPPKDVTDVEPKMVGAEPSEAVEPYTPAPQVWDFSELDGLSPKAS